jgi:hypothetical protein
VNFQKEFKIMIAQPRIKPKKIWDISRVEDREFTRMELTDLIRFKGYWYCGFREAEIHVNHPSGRGRIIRSLDGEHWESAALFEWEGADVREIKLSITPEGWLMGNTSLYFVSSKPRFPGNTSNRDATYVPAEAKERKDQPGLYYQLDEPGTPLSDLEKLVARQSVTWLSQDGIHWSSAFACASGVNCWRWEVTWHNGMGYSVGYRQNGAEGNGTLFRTRDGKEWRALTTNFFPANQGNEATIVFDRDGDAYSLLRDGRRRRNVGSGDHCPMLGIGTAPYYTEWQWKEIKVDLGDGDLLPVDEALLAPLGGPKLIQLKDGRLVAAGRVLLPGDSGKHISLFFLDPVTATLRKFVDIEGSSYAGIVEHEGRIWVSCADTTASAIYLAKVELPHGTS